MKQNINETPLVSVTEQAQEIPSESVEADSISQERIDALNEQYKLLSPTQRLGRLYKDFDQVLFTSSFGTTAVLLLNMLRQNNLQDKPVYFINTGYHFEETVAYKNQLEERFSLNVTELSPEEWKHEMTQKSKLWESHPDLCCSINKVEPLETVKGNHEVWISGIMAWQSTHRKDQAIFEMKNGILKFHPLIDMTEEETKEYMNLYDLPEHPLKPLGYASIGCTHCTKKGEGRTGRWTQSMGKTECGLHL